MIPIINHGSEEGGGGAEIVESKEDGVEVGKESKKALKGNIPKLEKEDRL